MDTASSRQVCKSDAINVSDDERKISIAAGAATLLFGMSGISMARLVLIAAGGALVYRGLSGHCALYESMKHSSLSGGDERTSDGIPENEQMDMKRLATTSARDPKEGPARKSELSPKPENK